MNTVVSDWQVVSIIEEGELIGKVLWCICIDDSTCRFSKGDYICTSQILEVNTNTRIIKTVSGSSYQLLGKGEKDEIEFKDFELLRNGFSPSQIHFMNSVTGKYQH